jgi:hypothetical protein
LSFVIEVSYPLTLEYVVRRGYRKNQTTKSNIYKNASQNEKKAPNFAMTQNNQEIKRRKYR